MAGWLVCWTLAVAWAVAFPHVANRIVSRGGSPPAQAQATASARRAIAGAALLAIGWAEAQREAAVEALASEQER